MDKGTDMTKTIALLGGLFLAVAAIWLIFSPHPEKFQVYSSSQYGITFNYSDMYELEGREVGNYERTHYVITLINKADLPIPVNGEGPRAITIDIFENDLDSLTSEDFIKTTANSNYKLGDGVLSQMQYGQIEGIEYGWSGLYEGRSIVVSRPGYIFMFSVTRDGQDDQIVSDFKNLLESVVLK